MCVLDSQDGDLVSEFHLKTQFQNGVDGGVIHKTFRDTSQSAMGAVTSLQGPMGITDGQVM